MKKKSLIHLSIAAGILVVALVAYTLWFLTVDGLGKEVSGLESEIQARANESGRVAEARTALASLATNEARLRNYFINTNEVVLFLERIGATGRALGADVEVVHVQAETATESRGNMTLALRISGSFDSVMRTVGAIEFGPFDSALTDISLDARPDSDIWTASATFAIGVQNPN
ncbi:MAG TPA: hypothetical protein VNU47_00665 [Candidatus Paceibacterota bacterium]|nr:hypothetical protein [Candidatus Paceibacterota bacterium]